VEKAVRSATVGLAIGEDFSRGHANYSCFSHQ
jgi:hypothetical protein